MSSLSPTLSASVPPPASVAISSPIRGLSADLLEAPATVALARLEPQPPTDPYSASASDFFAAFAPE
ncbi:MAG: hypothetical protein K0R38_6406 [Polyangiaceae bacterium]|jgi:hypothetical protein|nr:hypothetical protein [Polyangiaceae bacterium]